MHFYVAFSVFPSAALCSAIVSCDATFILSEAPLRSTSAHGILISGYAHAVHGGTLRACVGGANFASKI